MTVKTTPIQRAMAAQLKRVNESPEVLLRRLAEAEAQIAIRDELIAKLQQRLIDQEADRLSSPSPSMERGQGGEVASRPAVTIADYCRANSLTYMQAYRALRGETKRRKLEGYQDRFHNWWVYTS